MESFSIRRLMRRGISLMLRVAPPRLADFLMWPVSKRIFGKYDELVEIGGNIKMRVYGDMEDMVNKSLLFMGGFMPFAWEPITARLVVLLVPDIKCAVVAGAHIGYYPAIIAGTNSKAKVFAFEPNPLIYDRLLANLEINRAKNVVPMCAALGDIPGRKKMYFDFGQSSLLETGRKHAGSGDVEITTLDNVFKDEKLLPDLLILDAEGYEAHIFAGAKSIFERCSPDVIFEINPKALRAAGSSADELCQFFLSRGYSIFLVDEPHSGRFIPETELTVKLAPYTGSLPIELSFINAFATIDPKGITKRLSTGTVNLKKII